MPRKRFICDYGFQPEISAGYIQEAKDSRVLFPTISPEIWHGSDLPPPVIKEGDILSDGSIVGHVGPEVTMPKKSTLVSGMKYDGEKPRMGLIPMLALTEVAKVLTYGAKKYSPDNWRKVEGLQERYYDAALRHLTEYKYDKTDPESNLSHLAHCMCSLMFMLEDQLLAEKA